MMKMFVLFVFIQSLEWFAKTAKICALSISNCFWIQGRYASEGGKSSYAKDSRSYFVLKTWLIEGGLMEASRPVNAPPVCGVPRI